MGIPLLIAWLVSAISVSKISFKAKDIEAEMELERNKDAHFVDLFKVKLVDELRKAARQYDYTVIFEDFDRTGYDNCISLFTDLREINRLINYSTSKFGKKHPVRFIYILQDDLFAASKRADGPNRMARSLQLKFFDFIIPFIPEIYGNASAEYIYKCLKAADVRDESCHEFIETTGNCLYDYRTIHNIANEYQIIKSIYLGTNEMKSNKQSENQVAKKDGNAVDDSRVDKKILALAAYKTLMPDDYARIRTGESLLFDIGFESLKDSMIDPCVRSLWEHQWLDGTCLEFVGLNAHVINRYISRIISAETGKASPDLVHWIEHIYPLWRRALLEDADSLDKILKKYAYTLLCLELENSSPDFTLIQKAFDREMNMTEEDFGAGGFDNKIYKLMQKARECPNLVVQYLLRFNCSEWSWLFTSNLPVKQFGMCISLPDNEKQKLFEAAKGPIAEYINGLEGEQLKELINSIDLKDAELIGKLSINPEIKVAIEKGPYYGGRR